MKKLAMSVVGMAFAVVATNASAVLIEDFGLAPDPDLGEIGYVVLLLGDDGVGLNDPGPIEHEYRFTIGEGEEALVSTSVETLFNEIAGVRIFDVNNLNTSLTGPDGVIFDRPGVEIPDDGSFSNSGPLDPIGPGMYSFLITADNDGFRGGRYIGAITLVNDVTTIPIPAAGLLFFSGIAALGLVRSKHASA